MDIIMQQVVTFFVKNKPKVIRLFQFSYAVLLVYLFIGGMSIADKSYRFGVYELSKIFGTIAIVLFGLTILPGIARRFGIKHPLFTILMLFRRQLGILTFVFGFVHYCLLELFPVMFGVQEFFPMVFKMFGLGALFIMIILFFTSNDASVRKMGKWWGRVHMLVYASAWLLFGHLIFVGVGVQTILIATLALLETVSLVYVALKKKPQATS